MERREVSCVRGKLVDIELDFERRYRLVREIIETVVLTILMFLVIRLAVQNFNIDGMSMEPSLHNQELILVDKWSYLFHEPTRGDVVVFVAPPNPSQDYIKRIVGLPGDMVTITDNTVVVNNKPLTEFYVDPRRQGNPYAPFRNRVIPPDTYFVLGDNRRGSSDSRDWGCLPKKNLIGRAALVYWPLGQDNNGMLPSASSVFHDVGQPSGTPADTCPVITPRVPMGTAQSAPDGTMNQLLILALPGIFVACARRRERAL